MALPERVEGAVALPVVAIVVLERVEHVSCCPWFSKRGETCFARARAMQMIFISGFWSLSKMGYICSLRLKESLLSNNAPSRGRSGS